MRVTADFLSRNDRELTVRKGEMVEVSIEINQQLFFPFPSLPFQPAAWFLRCVDPQLLDKSKQWWKVRNNRGEEGFVPNNVLGPPDEQPIQVGDTNTKVDFNSILHLILVMMVKESRNFTVKKKRMSYHIFSQPLEELRCYFKLFHQASQWFWPFSWYFDWRGKITTAAQTCKYDWNIYKIKWDSLSEKFCLTCSSETLLCHGCIQDVDSIHTFKSNHSELLFRFVSSPKVLLCWQRSPSLQKWKPGSKTRALAKCK